jgi:hypothetical protein
MLRTRLQFFAALHYGSTDPFGQSIIVGNQFFVYYELFALSATDGSIANTEKIVFRSEPMNSLTNRIQQDDPALDSRQPLR